MHPYICSKPHDSFQMTSHGHRKHLVAFRTRTPRKSESVYYNLQFWLFLWHFWTFLCLVLFFPETFIWLLTWLVTLRRGLAQFALPRKASEHPICSFLAEPKIASKLTWMHPHIRSKPHESYPTTSHVPRRNLVAFGDQTRKSPKTCIITFNFSCFCNIFGLLWAELYFPLKHF